MRNFTQEGDINWHEPDPDDFQKAILGGEIKKHDVEIIAKFSDGTERKCTVKWEFMVQMYSYHNESMVKDMYEMLVT